MSFADSFRAARWIRTLNLVLQAMLFISLFSGLNYLSLHYSWRFDLTEHRRHSLSPETESYIKGLRAPVDIVITLTEDAENPELIQALRDLNAILREYTSLAEKNPEPELGIDGRIRVEYLDVFKRRVRAEELGIEEPNIILVKSGDQRRIVKLTDLYQIEDMQKRGFKGEQALTNAILSVSNPSNQKIYFLLGHGEMRPDDVDYNRGLSVLYNELRLRNFNLASLEIAREKVIPDDAVLLIIPAPKTRYEPIDEERIREWLNNKAGRLILMLSPGQSHGLDNILYDWGLVSDDVRIHDNSADGQNDSGDLILQCSNSRSPITTALFSNKQTFRFGTARPARLDPGRKLDAGLQVETLIETSPHAWGERDKISTRAQRFDAGIDIKGPLAVASSSERVSPPKDMPFTVRGGRVVLFGGADFAANGRLNSGANLSLILSAVNWTVDRDTQLNVPARPIERFQLSLTQQELANLRYSLILGVPGAAALFGLIVYWTRRR